MAVMRDLLRDLLTQAGYRVRLAMNGTDALAHCTRHGAASAPASLALLDMNMPHGDGIETCRLLRQLPGWQRVPIVMVTAQNTDGAVRDALEAGIDGFVVKPFSGRDPAQACLALDRRVTRACRCAARHPRPPPRRRRRCGRARARAGSCQE